MWEWPIHALRSEIGKDLQTVQMEKSQVVISISFQLRRFQPYHAQEGFTVRNPIKHPTRYQVLVDFYPKTIIVKAKC